ncbi:hypothetical protein BaRGS_00010850 [Batillaria attramentaria]|uniref:Uncharacterized protein n=1 Tax=Batillaria attramentaria TaxID=370345 RepID=A0ABD0LG96_9CAEN
MGELTRRQQLMLGSVTLRNGNVASQVCAEQCSLDGLASSGEVEKRGLLSPTPPNLLCPQTAHSHCRLSLFS